MVRGAGRGVGSGFPTAAVAGEERGRGWSRADEGGARKGERRGEGSGQNHTW